jgi:hypothetical protein
MDKQSSEQDKQKYEREIEEILAKFDKEREQKKRSDERETRPVVPIRGYSNPRKSGPSLRGIPGLPKDWRRIGAGQYIAAAFAVALLAVFLRGLGPLSSLLVILSVVLFFIPVFLYRSTGNTSGGWTPNEQKRWRGQVIDFNTRREISNDPLAAIKRWFRRR